MSQPDERTAAVSVPGGLDRNLGEFWAPSPWQIVEHGHNLSAFERNRVFLNVKGEAFFDISHLTGADSDGDGRSVVAADFRNNGQLDLLVRQAGGGALLLFENRFPRRNYLDVLLRGTKSNRQGIGARLTAVVNGRQIVRELFPANSYLSQAPNRVHFGLGNAETIEKLTIRWPSGEVQELRNVTGNRRILIHEGRDASQAIEPLTAKNSTKP